MQIHLVICVFVSVTTNANPFSNTSVCLFIVEREVEVVLSLERQNKSVRTCHYGVNNSITSASVGRHFGRNKMYSMLSQVIIDLHYDLDLDSDL